MNGGSTSKRTPPQRQLPRMILLIHDSQQSPINSQLVEVADYNIFHVAASSCSERPRYRVSKFADFPTATILQRLVKLVAAPARKNSQRILKFDQARIRTDTYVRGTAITEMLPYS